MLMLCMRPQYEPRYEKTGFLHMRKQRADPLRSNCAADQRVCFRYTDSTIPLLLNTKFQASSHLLWLYSPVFVGPGRKPRRPGFSQQGSYVGSCMTETDYAMRQHVLHRSTCSLGLSEPRFLDCLFEALLPDQQFFSHFGTASWV